MGSLRNIANRIPQSERAEILEKNLIFHAVASGHNSAMHHLMVVWKEYIEPDLQVTCNLCFQRVLDNFRALEHVLIKLEQEHRLLDEA